MKMNETESGQNLLDGALFTKMVYGGASELREYAAEINNLNVFPVPDGDTGDNMRMTLEGGIAALDKIESDHLGEVAKTLAHGMLLGARGNSGVILSQFFAGISKGLESLHEADAHALGQAFVTGVEKAYASVVTPKEGTILTVAREATEYAVAHLSVESTVFTLFSDLLEEMHNSLLRTPDLLPVLKEAGVIDSGGAGLLHILNGFNRVLNGEEASLPTDFMKSAQEKPAAEINLDAFGPDSVLTFGYCTEFLLRLQNAKVDMETFDHNVIVEFLSTIGDSIVAFRNDSIVKVHVHTKTPEKVLEFCHQFGEFLTLKIENMSVQHSSSEGVPEEKEEEIVNKQYAIVTVCSGEGIRDTFYEMGADVVIDGGQTQNPSTNDFLDAFEKVHADHILCFPNNGNILLAAKQAAEMYTKSAVHVIETVNIGEGYAALPAIEETEPDVNVTLERIREMISNVSEGEITTSIRNTDLHGCHINVGDAIALHKKKVIVSSPERTEAAKTLLRAMMEEEERFTLTIFYGTESTEEERDAITAFTEENYPDLEVYFIEGKQGVYPYIFIAE